MDKLFQQAVEYFFGFKNFFSDLLLLLLFLGDATEVERRVHPVVLADGEHGRHGRGPHHHHDLLLLQGLRQAKPGKLRTHSHYGFQYHILVYYHTNRTPQQALTEC